MFRRILWGGSAGTGIPFLLSLFKPYEQLRSIRNDVNHGGFITEENKRASSISMSILLIIE